MTTVTPPYPSLVFVAGMGSTSVPATATRASIPGGEKWHAAGVEMSITECDQGLSLTLEAAGTAIERVALRWTHPVARGVQVLGDAWERGYGDLGFRPLDPGRCLPWYAVVADAQHHTVWAMGVDVRPAAMCSWSVDSEGATLWLDVRSGRRPLLLSERRLDVATVRLVRVESEGTRDLGQAAFLAARDLCTAMCPGGVRPTSPLVGSNNWYYAYGVDFDADAVVADAEWISSAARGQRNRPFATVDAGWSEGGTAPGGPWDRGMGTFTDMSQLATRLRDAGTRPALWFRPLLSREPTPGARMATLDGAWPLDPSDPRVLHRVQEDVRRFSEWGFELVKHDFSTYDIFGAFLNPSGVAFPAPRWDFQDQTRTTAEIVTSFYQAMHCAAGDMAILGCNTISHLSAGLVTASRVGDDTSGRQWERTRRMGVNSLAFRLAQHGLFYTVDPDCVALTPQTPQEKNLEFLRLVAASGTALFISAAPECRTASVTAQVSEQVMLALDGGLGGCGEPGLVPADWLETSSPARWVSRDGSQHQFSWLQPWGADPLLDGAEGGALAG